mgnify:CR=1 FL=1
MQLAVALSHSITATEQKSNAMNRLSITLAGLLLLLGSQVQAESVESMLQEMAIIEKNTPLLQAAIEDGVERVEDAVASLNEYVQSVQRDLTFRLDDTSGKTVITVYDRNTEEVVRQMPDDVALRLARDLQQDEPLSLFNIKV